MSKPKKKIAFVIAHYHQEGKLPRDFFEHIKYIKHLSNNITLVSTRLNNVEIERLKPYANVIVRQNKGYDFYSYKIGLSSIKNIAEIDHLILFNSSFVTINPEKLYRRFLSDVNEDGFYGITSCSDPNFHIQSYFFSFKGSELINSNLFKLWWKNIKYLRSKLEVIHKYEVGMSIYFRENGIKLIPVFKFKLSDQIYLFCTYIFMKKFNVKKIKKFLVNQKKVGPKGLNITHFLWQSILKDFSIIKIELIKFNPTNRNLKNLNFIFDETELLKISDAK